MHAPQPAPKTPIAPALRAHAEDARRTLSPHPSDIDLIAYHERRLDEDHAERLRDHLALCPDCSDFVLELARFSAPVDENTPTLTPDQIDDLWHDLAPRLATAPAPEEPRRRSPHALAAWQALAAVLAVAVIGGGIWIANLQRALKTPTPASIARASANTKERGANILLPPRGTYDVHLPAFLPIRSTHADPRKNYRYEIDAEGKTIRSDALAVEHHGEFALYLPNGSLAPGKYHLFIREAPIGSSALVDSEIVVADEHRAPQTAQ